MPRQYRIGVVGFGVAGATFSHLLAKAGNEVSLFERAPRVGPVGAGVLLQPSGQMVLERIGLLERVIARSEPIDELYAQTHRGRTLIQLRYGEIEPGCRAYGVHRGDLFQALHEAVVEQGVRVCLGHEIRSHRVVGEQVFVTDALGLEHGPFDFVIVADGTRSALRNATGMVRWDYDYPYGALWALGPCTALCRKLHQVVRGTHTLLGLLPMGSGRCSLFWSVRCSSKDALWQRGFAAWRTEVLTLCPLAAEVFEAVTSFEQVTYTTYKHVWMSRWHNDRVVFLGDAAHAMSPHLGQGLNLALLDAYQLAQALGALDDHRAAFRYYNADRLGHVRFYGCLSLLLTPFFQSGGIVKGIGRDLALPLMTRIPWIRRQMLLSMAGIKKGFLPGRLALPCPDQAPVP